MADKALAVPYVLRPLTGREVDPVYIHSIGVRMGGSASRQNITVSPSLEFPESYHISVELSCFVKPLFPLPASLFLPVREGGGGYHDGKLLGYSSLEGVFYKNAVVIDSAACLGQFESGGVFVEVSIELVHAEGIDSLAGSILDVFWDKGFFEGLA